MAKNKIAKFKVSKTNDQIIWKKWFLGMGNMVLVYFIMMTIFYSVQTTKSCCTYTRLFANFIFEHSKVFGKLCDSFHCHLQAFVESLGCRTRSQKKKRRCFLCEGKYTWTTLSLASRSLASLKSAPYQGISKKSAALKRNSARKMNEGKSC